LRESDALVGARYRSDSHGQFGERSSNSFGDRHIDGDFVVSAAEVSEASRLVGDPRARMAERDAGAEDYLVKTCVGLEEARNELWMVRE
jgi:hypothetical protein